jgi:phosphotransferase system HPr-like phosphotransfer protein
MFMQRKIIKINNMNEIDNFITLANHVDGDVTIHKGKFTVDGKSYLGVMYIGIYDPVIVEYPATASEFNKFLSQYETVKGD